MKIHIQALVLIAALLFSSASHAQSVEPTYPADASFHYVGTTEYWITETVSVYSESSGTFVSGPSTVVEEGIIAAELWVDTVLVAPQAGESTTTGQITVIRGTPAGRQVGDPLTAASLLAPFGIGVTDDGIVKTVGITDTEVTVDVSADDSDDWSISAGELNAEGVIVETDDQNQTWVTSDLDYNFEITAQPGGSIFVAQEELSTKEMQGDVPPVEGTVVIERTVFSMFNGSPSSNEPITSFHYPVTTEYRITEKVSVYSESSGTFVSGPSTVVDQGFISSELWIDTVLVAPQAGESTTTGQITAVRGTPAGRQVGDPLTAASLLAPFGIGTTDVGNVRTIGSTDTEVTVDVSADESDDWNISAGELNAAGFIFETDDQNRIWVTSGLDYNLEITAQPAGNLGNSFVVQEILLTREIQGDVPAVEGTVLLERRQVSVFVPGSTTAIPTLSMYGLIFASFGMMLIAGRRLRKIRCREHLSHPGSCVTGAR
jgi:hypothetical protein